MNVATIVNALKEAVPDISAEEFEDLLYHPDTEVLDEDDEQSAQGYAVSRLERAGIADPIAYLVEHDIIVD